MASIKRVLSCLTNRIVVKCYVHIDSCVVSNFTCQIDVDDDWNIGVAVQMFEYTSGVGQALDLKGMSIDLYVPPRIVGSCGEKDVVALRDQVVSRYLLGYIALQLRMEAIETGSGEIGFGVGEVRKAEYPIDIGSTGELDPAHDLGVYADVVVKEGAKGQPGVSRVFCKEILPERARLDERCISFVPANVAATPSCSAI